MLAVTFLVSAVTLGTGRTHMMQGAVHLVIFARVSVPGACPLTATARVPARATSRGLRRSC